MIQYHLNFYYRNGRRIGNFELIQIGRLWSGDSTFYTAHVQKDYYELTIITSGEGTIYTNNIPTAVKEGDIYLSLPTDLHQIQSSESNPLDFDFFTFRISDEEFAPIFEKIAISLHHPTKRVFSDRKINYLVSSALLELSKPSKYSDKVLENILNLIATYIIRDLYAEEEYTSEYKLDSATAFCYRIMNYIDVNLFSIENLKSIAQKANYSYSHISTIFKKITGKTINDYFLNKKLTVAKQLLDENKLKAVEISNLLNYTSYFSFNRAFKLKYGVSPQLYRKNKFSLEDPGVVDPVEDPGVEIETNTENKE